MASVLFLLSSFLVLMTSFTSPCNHLALSLYQSLSVLVPILNTPIPPTPQLTFPPLFHQLFLHFMSYFPFFFASESYELSSPPCLRREEHTQRQSLVGRRAGGRNPTQTLPYPASIQELASCKLTSSFFSSCLYIKRRE